MIVMSNFTLLLLLLGMPQFLLAVIQSAVSNNVGQNMFGATQNVPGQLTLLADAPPSRNSLKMFNRSQTLPSLSISHKNEVRNSVVAKAVSGSGFGGGDGYSLDNEGDKDKERHALAWKLLRESSAKMGDKETISYKDMDDMEVEATKFLVLNKGHQTQNMLDSFQQSRPKPQNVPGQLTLLSDAPPTRNSLKLFSRSQTLPTLSISRRNGVRNSVLAKAVSGGGFGSGGDGYSSDDEDEDEKHKEVHALSWVLLREFQSSLRQLPVLMGDNGSISHKDLDNMEVVATLFLVLNKGHQTQSMLARALKLSALKLFMALRLRKRLLFHSDHIYRIQYRLEELEETGRPAKHLLASLDLGYIQDELWTPLGIESPLDAFMDSIGAAKNTFENARALLNVVKENEKASAAFAANVMKDLFEAEIILGYIENILKKCKNFRGWEDKDPPKPNVWGWDEPPKPKPNGWSSPNGSMN